MNELEIFHVDPKTLKTNQYSRSLFPELKGDAYKLLYKDIKENGIRTPLEITKEKVVLCGHERLRVALELGLSEVPVTYFANHGEAAQKIRIIRDNLARKAVDYRTKLRCYKELKNLYGLQGRDRLRAKNGQFTQASIDARVLSEDEIAKEVGFSAKTLERMEKIEASDLPDVIKDAAFKGKLSFYPTAELLRETEEIQEKVIEKVLPKLKEDDENVNLWKILKETKQQVETKKVMEALGVPSVQKQVKDFYGKISLPKKADKETKRTQLIEHIIGFIERQNLRCPVCNEKSIVWKCGHEFS